MNLFTLTVVLGSRSPQRLALLRQLIPNENILVCPPRQSEELGFAGLDNWLAIETRLREIARNKSADIEEQLQENPITANTQAVILTADTVIIANDGEQQLVLGQPPEARWRVTVRDWFENYLFGKTHLAASAVCLVEPSGRQRERVVVSEVTFCPPSEKLLDWYLDTEESRGKAGGYGIQGLGSLFVTNLTGSFSNVVGLPLREVWEMLQEAK